jgi:hypothetical protein
MMGNICKQQDKPVKVDRDNTSSDVPVVETMEREKPETVILELEQKGYEEVTKVLLNDKDAGDKLMTFMTAGAEEFKERTGRNMTYAEMRAAWG